MKKHQRDYTKLMYVGIDRDRFNQPEALVLLFQELDPEPSSYHVITNYEEGLVRVSASEFDKQFRDLGERIMNEKLEWECRNVSNYEASQLDKLLEQYAAMETIVRQVRGSSQPTKTR